MEETKNNVTENIQDNPNPEGKKTDNPKQDNAKLENAPSVEELMAQLAEAKAESQKYQNKYNQASNEAAESKKALRARQTAEEREAEEKAEAQRKSDEEKEAMRKELNHIKAVAAYKNIPEEKTVENLIAAISESDHASIALIIENEKSKAVKAAKAEWEKTTPPTQFGTGEYSSMTVEEAMKIPDREQRLKAIAKSLK